MNTPTASIGWTTAPSLEEAENIAEALVESGWVACSQVSQPITSVYYWKGKLCHDTEYRITLKFPDSNAGMIESWLAEHHPHDVPQWLWVRCSGASIAYEKWMME